ncbi:hypothetical protein D3C87_1077160 [compost metagenome]
MWFLIEDRAVVMQLALIMIENARASQVLRIDVCVGRRGIGKTGFGRRTTLAEHILQMSHVLGELLLDQELFDLPRRARVGRIRERPHGLVFVLVPFDGQRWRGQRVVLHAEPEIVAQRQA